MLICLVLLIQKWIMFLPISLASLQSVKSQANYINLSTTSISVFSISTRLQNGNIWLEYNRENEVNCLLYYTGTIQYSKFNIFSYYKITMIIQYEQNTCTEQLIIDFNGIQVLKKDLTNLSQGICYPSQKTLTVDWNQYIGFINNKLIIQITSSSSYLCSPKPPGINPQIQNVNQIQKVYYQQYVNALCPSYPDVKDIELCSSCLNQQNRILDSGKCKCKLGYYELNSSPTCLACLQACKECNDSIGCLFCFENASLINNQCLCNPGYFMNDSFRCQRCNISCKTCYFTENYCTQCIDQNQTLPSCSCPNGMFFDPDSLSCKNCNENCYTCQFNINFNGRNQCTLCAPGYVNPPICQKECTVSEVYDYNLMKCVPLVCDNKCNSCEKNSSNCLVCKGNRINPPICQCQLHYYDDEQSSNCIQCPDGQYFGQINDKQKGCLPCHFSCKHCLGPNINQCTECYNEQFTQTSDGFCQCIGKNKTLFKDELDHNLPKCVASLYINLSIYINNEFQQIYRISFSDPILKSIGGDQIMQNLIIYLESTPKSEYSFQQIFYDQNIIEFVMISQKVVPRQKLFIIAQNQKSFQGISNTILDIKYVRDPIFIKMIQDNVDYSSSQRNLAELKAASESVQSNAFVQFVTTYYFFLYILSTLQPTILFLLAQIQLPLNIQLYLKILGQFVFSKNQFFSWYQIYKTAQINETQYKILNLDFSQQLQKDVPTNEYFQQIGFLNNFFYNTQIPSLLFMIFTILHLICVIIYKIKYDHKTVRPYNLKQLQKIVQGNYQGNKNQLILEQLKQYTQEQEKQDQVNIQLLILQNSQSKSQERLDSIVILLRKLMISNLESNFVVYFVSVYLQFQNLDGDYFANRYSIYIMYIFLVQTIFCFKFSLKYMVQNQYEKIPIFTSRLELNQKKYYFHFYSLLGKFLTCLCLILTPFNFIVTVSIIVVIQALLLIYIIYNRPFKSKIYFVIKLLGTASFLLSWVCLLLIGIIRSQFNSVNIMSKEDQNQINMFGLMMIVSLSVFNSVYMISFIYDIVIICIQFIQQQLNKNKLIVLKTNESNLEYDLEDKNKSAIIVTNSNITVQNDQQKQLKFQNYISFIERFTSKKVENQSQKQYQLGYISNIHDKNKDSQDQS
ncbi:hypothetical protein ABPG74_004088 [Tetrahymena malaccensis]